MGEALGQPWPDPCGVKLKKIIDFDTHLCDIKLNLNVCIEDPCTKLGITTYTMWYKQLGLANQDFWSLGAES